MRWIALAALLAASVAWGQPAPAWEYQVVYLPGSAMRDVRKALEPQPDSSVIDRVKSDILTRLAADGWEVVTVAGDVGADHAVYLRRALP